MKKKNKLIFDDIFIIDKRPLKKAKKIKYNEIKEYTIKVKMFSSVYSRASLSKYLVLKTNDNKRHKVLIDNASFLQLCILNDDKKILELLKMRCPNARYVENKGLLYKLLK